MGLVIMALNALKFADMASICTLQVRVLSGKTDTTKAK